MTVLKFFMVLFKAIFFFVSVIISASVAGPIALVMWLVNSRPGYKSYFEDTFVNVMTVIFPGFRFKG